MTHPHPLASVSDDDLLQHLAELLRQSRRVDGDLIAHIGEVDERRLYAREAFPSMFAYCTEVLHLSEAKPYLRITVARAARKYPVLLTMLGEGRLHLSGISRLAPYFTLENVEALLKRAAHRSRRQIEELIAEIAPQPDVPPVMRKLAERQNGEGTGPAVARPLELCPDRVGPSSAVSPAPLPAPAGVIHPLAPARYKVQFTASAELHDKLQRLQALMRSQVPDGDLAEIIEQAVTEKLGRLEARRFAKTKAPRKGLSETDTAPSSRHIPAAVRRAVHERDDGRCRYVDAKGRRCSEQRRLEYHHRHPFGLGGDHGPLNVRLMCQAHNAYLAEHDYGREAMARCRRPRKGAREAPMLHPAAARRPPAAPDPAHRTGS